MKFSFSFNLRTITRIVAWFMLTVVFLSVVFNFFDSSEPEVIEEADGMLNVSISNVSTSFAKEWLTYNKGEQVNTFRNRIAPYVSPNLVNNLAGITNYDSLKPQRAVDAWLVSYSAINNTHCIATVGVHVVSADNVDTFLRINIPLALDADKNPIVYAAPSFSPMVLPNAVAGPNFGNAGQVTDINQLRITLDSFFQKYLSGQEQAELSNFLTESGKKVIFPKKGIVAYNNIQSVKTYPQGVETGSGAKWYTAIVDVQVKDPRTDMILNSQYVIFLQEQGSKYLIHQILP